MSDDHKCFKCQAEIEAQYGLCEACYRAETEASLAEATGTDDADIATRVRTFLANPKPVASHVMRLAQEHEGFDRQVLQLAAESLAYDWLHSTWLSDKVVELKKKIAALEAGAVAIQEAVGQQELEKDEEQS